MTARLPSMVEQLLGIPAPRKKREVFGRPFEPGMRAGKCTERVLALLTAEYPRLVRRMEIEARLGLTRNQAQWALAYLVEHHMAVSLRNAEKVPKHYLRYRAIAKEQTAG